MSTITPSIVRETSRDALLLKATWTVSDVCAFLSIDDDTLRRWRKRNKFLAPRVMPGGKSLRWDAAEVLAWWDARERAA
jgi:predicted DNA-binding transcriptional regulator AlpA